MTGEAGADGVAQAQRGRGGHQVDGRAGAQLGDGDGHLEFLLVVQA
jgi:hypothetical protein